MGIGFVLLVIGLAGLSLLQTAVVYRPESKGQSGLLDVRPQAPRRRVPAGRPALSEGSFLSRRTASNRLRNPGVKPSRSRRLNPGRGSGHRAPAVDTGGASEAINPSLAGSKARPHPSPEALQPVVIRFHFDPAQKREINVAQVHFGDSISVRVRRLGQANLGLHLAFAVPDTLETDAWRGWSAGSRRAVVAPIQDVDRIALSADRDFGIALTRKLDSKEGAVLKLGADYPRSRNPTLSLICPQPEAAPQGRAAMKSR